MNVVYACGTIDNDVPRVRHIVHRSFLSEDTSRPLLVTTTDVRTPKVSQLYSSGQVGEIAWWMEDSGEQYRITARTYVLPKPGHPLREHFPFERLRDASNESTEDNRQWWEKTRINVFDNQLGGALRASFCRPTPGSPLSGGYESAKEWPEKLPRTDELEDGSKEAAQVIEALNNFSLCVFEPFKVERIELYTVRVLCSLSGHECLGQAQFTQRVTDCSYLFNRCRIGALVGDGKRLRGVGRRRYSSPDGHLVLGDDRL